jgi:hypothetical protein
LVLKCYSIFYNEVLVKTYNVGVTQCISLDKLLSDYFINVERGMDMDTSTICIVVKFGFCFVFVFVCVCVCVCVFMSALKRRYLI